MKKVLITGAGGFIGSNCVEYFLEKTDWKLFLIDSFKHKGTYNRLQNVDLKKVKVFNHDLNVPIDPQLENLLLERSIDDKGKITEKPIHYIVNLASDSAVERSIHDPISCWTNNCAIAINMLEFTRKIKPELYLHIDSDECMGEAITQPHKEWDATIPSNPYAASKAAQRALHISYWRTYDLPIVICTLMNNIGEKQDPEKFLPKIIQYVAQEKEIPIYTDKNGQIGSRFYLHARNTADALIFLSKYPPAMYKDGVDRPDCYNICGIEVDNLNLAQFVARMMNRHLKYKLVTPETGRRGYDKRYALNGDKIKNLGWVPPLSFKESLERIVAWTMDNPHWLI